MRVDGFSNINASVFPASGREVRPPARLIRRRHRHLGEASLIEVAKSRKWRAGALCVFASLGRWDLRISGAGSLRSLPVFRGNFFSSAA